MYQLKITDLLLQLLYKTVLRINCDISDGFISNVRMIFVFILLSISAYSHCSLH